MLLRGRLEQYPETLQDFELAAEAKYYEGLELLVDGCLGAGIYLLGYVAEMHLKYACMYVSGDRPGSPVSLAPHKKWAAVYLPHIDCESYHSVLFWGMLLRRRRVAAKLAAFDPRFDAIFSRAVRRLYLTWWIDMRYRSDQATSHEAQAVYNDVTWLRKNRLRLGC
jgi:hypothetical protein